MIELKDYQKLIKLTPHPKVNAILPKEEKEQIVQKLLDIIKKEFSVNIKQTKTYEEKRDLLWGLLNKTPPHNFGNDFFNLQDKLLQSEANEKKIVTTNDLKFVDNIAIFQGDITSLKVDAIVNAGNSKLLGCFVPLHKCIDNVIISCGGFQIRNDLNAIMKKQGHDEPNGNAKITSAYNLPSKFVIHTVGPCVHGQLTEKDKNELASCYVSSLNLAKEMNLKSIAFCCISTGAFCFPNDIACKIAINTVKNWLKDSGYDIKVVFNVFKDLDKKLYDKQLK